ncbi:prepilin peptidase [Enterococcus sp. LJL98]
MFIFYIGCCIGSFLTVVAWRLPIGQDFIFSRSNCPHCQKKLKYYELLPLFSIIISRFRCSTCKIKVPIFYLFSELSYGFLLVILVKQTPSPMQVPFFLWLTMAYLLSLTDYFYLIVEPKILASFGTLLWFLLFYQQWVFHLGTFSFVCFATILISLFFRSYLGFGDLLLLLIWSPWLTFTQFFLLLACASCSALLFFICYFLFKRQVLLYLPFVPFLSLGLLIVLIF